jgi:uncharacterized protein (TIGR02588 family)
MPEKNPLEWAVFGVSLLLILAVAAVLAFEAARSDDAPPQLLVRPGAATQAGELLTIPVRVENRGGEVAEELLVALTVYLADGRAEEAELHIPLLPAGANSESIVAVPTTGEVRRVEARVVSFVLP